MKLYQPHRYFHRKDASDFDKLVWGAKADAKGPVFRDVKKRKMVRRKPLKRSLHVPAETRQFGTRQYASLEARKKRATPPNWRLKRAQAAKRAEHNLHQAAVKRHSSHKCTCVVENRFSVLRVVMDGCKLHRHLRVW